MQLLFVDESGDQKFKEYFGICVAAVNSAHYRTAKSGFHRILREAKWDETIEFKGSHLFSASKGDPAVSIERRVEMASNILNLNKSDSNARMRFHYSCRADCKDHKAEYLARLPALITRALPYTTKKNGKDLVALSCDGRTDISAAEIQLVALPAIQ